MSPALTKDDVIRLRGDLSPFLIHLTRSGTYKEWADISGNAQDNFIPLIAKDSLELLIASHTIEARCPFGYFNFKVRQRKTSGLGWNNTNSGVARSWLRSVCFTETPVDHVHLQTRKILGRQCQFEPYGLAFFEASVRSNGGSPVVYFESSNLGIRKALDAIPSLVNITDFKALMPLVEGFGIPLYSSPATEVDFRWEREWRIAGDFTFTDPDVAFGLCRQSEIPYFERLVQNRFLFIDPTSSITTIKTKLRTDSRLQDLK